MTVNILISTHINFVIDLNRKAIFNRFVCVFVFVFLCVGGRVYERITYTTNSENMVKFLLDVVLVFWGFSKSVRDIFDWILYNTIKNLSDLLIFSVRRVHIISFYQINVPK